MAFRIPQFLLLRTRVLHGKAESAHLFRRLAHLEAGVSHATLLLSLEEHHIHPVLALLMLPLLHSALFQKVLHRIIFSGRILVMFTGHRSIVPRTFFLIRPTSLPDTAVVRG